MVRFVVGGEEPLLLLPDKFHEDRSGGDSERICADIRCDFKSLLFCCILAFALRRSLLGLRLLRIVLTLRCNLESFSDWDIFLELEEALELLMWGLVREEPKGVKDS